MDTQQKIVTAALLILAVMVAQMVLAGDAFATDTGDPNKHSNANITYKWEDGSGDITHTTPDPYAEDQEYGGDGEDSFAIPAIHAYGDEHPANGTI